MDLIKRIVGKGFIFFCIRCLSMVSGSTCLVTLFGFLMSCNEFPEQKNKPYLSVKGDTVVFFKRVILSGDSIIFHTEYASHTEKNTIVLGSARVRNSDQPFEFQGPDSAFIFNKSFSYVGKIRSKIQTAFSVPGGILPGSYTFYSQMVNDEGVKSDSGKFTFFITNSAYPLFALDTPLNGITAVHAVDSLFKLQVRSYSVRLKSLQLQWFDSLKLNSESDLDEYLYPEGSELTVLNTLYSIPKRKGRRFYLRAIVSSLDDRKILYWIPFDKKET